MCNNLHNKYTPIKETGFGYKIFTKNLNPKIRALSGFFKFSKYYIGTLYIWDKYMNYTFIPDKYGDGFCFFLTKKEAVRCLKEYTKKRRLRSKSQDYKRMVIKKIQYFKGLGKQIEDHMVQGSYLITLCKQFKILREEK